MTPLEAEIRRLIARHGPMGVDRFMGLAVGHYYATRDPFGAAGDFTTAPEISQMFGELLGAWAADQWMRLGSPAQFILMEAGPGRGTLMADALRATKKVPGFHAAMRLSFLEASPVLKEKQKAALADYNPQWIESFDSFDSPVILFANEFLDALPVQQEVFADGVWRERTIILREGKLAWHPDKGDIREISPAREEFVRRTAQILKRCGGAALFIDYGYESGRGDTLQAVKNHEFVSVLDDVGEADLTAHVDFGALAKIAAGEGVPSSLKDQGAFLRELGIAQRAEMLSSKATEEQKKHIAAALSRLTGENQMGRLFKVLDLRVLVPEAELIF